MHTLSLYFTPISFHPPQLADPKPSPFFKQDDQQYKDTEDDMVYGDEIIRMLTDKKGRFIRNAKEKDETSVAYYNKWIMENRG